MKKILALMVFIFPVITNAQYFPDYESNPGWNILVWENAEANYGYTKTYRFSKDTSFCDKDHNILEIDNQKYYLNNNAGKVYFRTQPDCNANEYLLYDFNAMEGDTMYVGYLQEPDFDHIDTIQIDTAGVFVDNIDFAQYDGVSRKTISLLPIAGSDFQPDTWISGIGSTIHPLYSIYHGYGSFELAYDLLCADSSGTQLFTNVQYNTCDTSFTGEVDVKKIYQDYRVYPNPFKNYIALNLDDLEYDYIKLTDINGRTVIDKKLDSNVISTENLSKGFLCVFHL